MYIVLMLLNAAREIVIVMVWAFIAYKIVCVCDSYVSNLMGILFSSF